METEPPYKGSEILEKTGFLNFCLQFKESSHKKFFHLSIQYNTETFRKYFKSHQSEVKGSIFRNVKTFLVNVYITLTFLSVYLHLTLY